MSASGHYLNLGCGNRYHPDWVNIDIAARGPGVIRHDLAGGIPLPDASCAVVYHTAMLEHLRRADVPGFLAECRRVLKPGGILRVGVPDLEQACRLYLEKLAAAHNGEPGAEHDYDWMMLELLDQSVRERGGGAMLDFLRQDPLPNESFVMARIGVEGRLLMESLRPALTPRQGTAARARGGWRRLRALPGDAKQRLIRWLIGKDGLRALEIGRFRLAGEVHHWAYDRYSLGRLMSEGGFQHPTLRSATTSQIPNWASYNLDTLPDGQAIKPDLFFMEGTKPN